MGSTIITSTVSSSIGVIKSLQSSFVMWGQEIFWAFLTISIVLKCLEYAANKGDIADNLSDWTRELLGSFFFLSLILNLTWLNSLSETVQIMGKTFSGTGLDPSSIIDMGISTGNNLLSPLKDSSSIMNFGISTIILGGCFLFILYCFFNIAFDVGAYMLVLVTIIAVSPIFLACGAWKPTAQIARNAVDAVAGYCVILLGYFIVVFVMNKTINQIVAYIPTDTKPSSYDAYLVVVAACGIFHKFGSLLPPALSKIVTGAISENRGSNIGAMATSVMTLAKSVSAPLQTIAAKLSEAAKSTAQVSTATLSNAMANYRQIASSNPNGSMASKTGAALKQAAGTTAGATANNVSDRFRNIADRASGGGGNDVKSVAERVYQNTQSVKSQTQAKSK